MNFLITNNKYNILTLGRKIGYHPDRHNKSFSRRLDRNEFPRFHIYHKELLEGLELSLHLDQKGACHQGQTAHSGDYQGEVLEAEKARIINLLKD